MARKFAKSCSTHSAGRPLLSQPFFSLGDDLQMDSIDDLERRGGSAKDFGIEVVGYSYDRIRFQSFMNPEADFYSLSDSGRWEMHNKLKAFLTREGSSSRMPSWAFLNC